MKILYLFAVSVILLSCSTKNDIRKNEDFTQDWQFYLGDDSLASNSQYDDSGWRILDLPHDWSIEANFSKDAPATPGGGALPGGIGWYRKTFTVDNSKVNKNVFIDFDGIYRNSKVWINGHLLGERPYGYISFRYDLTPYLKIGEKNVIAVRVDNSQQPNSRWYSGSGIYRNVWLVTVNPLYIDHWGTYVTTPQVSDEKAEINVRTIVKNTSADSREFVLHSIVVDKDGKEIMQASDPMTLAAGKMVEIQQNFSINQLKLWSIENPYLYKVISRIEQKNQVVDNYETPLGIRYFTFDVDKGFFLNGKPVKILGVCDHHDLGCLGSAVNTRALERQLETLKAMGCNGIRTSHNPPAPELLDLCDRMGFIVMDEAFDMWKAAKTPYDYSRDFPEWHEKDLTDMVLRDRNHPSVFMWSIGNEVLEQWSQGMDTTKAQILTRELADIVKKTDPTRPITAACNGSQPSNPLFRSGAMDIIGFNYQTKDWLTFQEKFPGKKFIITESTSGLMSRGYYKMPSDSIFIWSDKSNTPSMSPEAQHCSAYDNCHVPWGTTHEESWKLVKKYDYISGMYIWTGFDYLGEPTPFWWPSRSSYFGIIDLAGFPKDVYYMYQSEWTDKTVLHLFPHWNWQKGQPVDVWAYYNNADEVELFLNGQSLGRKSKTEDELRVWWRVPFEKGTLKAVSYKDGKEVMTQEIKTAGDPVSIRLTADRQTIKADGKDLSFVTVEALDAAGNVVPVAENKIDFSIEGAGFIAGTDNGNPTDSISLKNPSRNLFNGKALVVVQAGKKAGNITLKAKSDNLGETNMAINVQ